LPFVAAGYVIAGLVSVVLAGSYPVPSVSLLITTGLWALLQVAFYYLVAFGLACLVGSRSYTIGILLDIHPTDLTIINEPGAGSGLRVGAWGRLDGKALKGCARDSVRFRIRKIRV